MNRHLLAIATAALLATFALAAGATGAAERTTNVAPAHLVVNGKYSDVRFIDMTVPHHLMAIAMARIELQKGSRSELKDMARQMISEQQGEIADLKSLRRRLTGSARTPTVMSPHQMQQSGIPMPAQLSRANPTDLAFIDAMVPHHASLIPLSNVVLRRSSNATLRQMARSMIDSQGRQIGQMIVDRQAWYPSTVVPPRP